MNAQQFRMATLCCLVSAAILVPGYVCAQATLQVKPGLTIPDSKTPWALETFQGVKQLVPIHHSEVTINQHTGANLAGSLAGSFLYKAKLTTELKGLNSRNQLHSQTPVIYFLIDTDQDEAGDGKSSDSWNFILVRVLQSRDQDKRTIDRVAVSQVSGNATRKAGIVVDADVSQLPNHWYRVQPKSAMPEGEYALVPVWKTKGMSSTVVWDFGINLSAPNENDVVVAKP